MTTVRELDATHIGQKIEVYADTPNAWESRHTGVLTNVEHTGNFDSTATLDDAERPLTLRRVRTYLSFDNGTYEASGDEGVLPL